MRSPAIWAPTLLSVAAFAPSVLLYSPGASAQVLEEVVVVARRKEENLQEIPVAVNVFGADDIEAKSIRNLDTVAELTPNLQFDQGFWPSDTRVSIRGLFARAGRPSAAVLIDGIDAQSEALESAGGSALLNTRLLDVERIEVVKGPQSALYGRGAFGGAVNYITRKPSDEFNASASLDVGEDGKFELIGAIGGPIIDGLLNYRLNAATYEFDGYYENPNTGDDLGGGESTGVGLAFSLTPTDNFTATLHGMYSEDEYDPQAIAAINPNEVLGPIDGILLEAVTGDLKADESQIDVSPDPSRSDVRDYPGTDDELFRLHLILDWDFDKVDIKWSNAYVDFEHDLNLDTTQQAKIRVPAGSTVSFGNANYADYFQTFEQWQTELVFNVDQSDEMNWLFGLNGFWEEADDQNSSRYWYRDAVNNGLCFIGAPCSYDAAPVFDKKIERDTKSFSMFGLVNYAFTDKLTGTIEARWIYDRVDVFANSNATATSVLAPPFEFVSTGTVDGKESDTNFVPRFALDYAWTDDVLFYGSIANGIKPPTFNTTDIIDADVARVAKEDLWSYELGAKTSWLDGAMQLNSAVYYHDYEDRQVRIQFAPPPGGFVPLSGVTNASETEVIGVELEWLWQATDNLTLGAQYAYNDGEIEDFNLSEIQDAGVPISSSNIVKSGNAEGDFSGNDLFGIPDHAFSFSARYQRQLTNEIDWFVLGYGNYEGERYADLANLVTLESYWLFNAQIGVETDKWSVVAYGNNLFDDDTVRFAQEFIDQAAGFNPFNEYAFPVAYYAYLPPTQEFGIRASIRY